MLRIMTFHKLQYERLLLGVVDLYQVATSAATDTFGVCPGRPMVYPFIATVAMLCQSSVIMVGKVAYVSWTKIGISISCKK